MADVSARAVAWLCGVLDLMREPLVKMPTQPVLQLLHEAYGAAAASRHWLDETGRMRTTIDPADALQGEQPTQDEWVSGRLWDAHPLLTWFVRTQDPAPQTAARVPTALVPRRRRMVLEVPLRRLGLEHQLSIPYRLTGRDHQAFVLGRGDRDFSDDDVLLSRYVQRSLVALDAQVRVLRGTRVGGGPVDAAGLTGRELAALRLVAAGETIRAAARRLACSPRTVEKHLEHCYRKLGVRDRVNAIRVAQLAGLIEAPGRSTGRAVGEPDRG